MRGHVSSTCMAFLFQPKETFNKGDQQHIMKVILYCLKQHKTFESHEKHPLG